MKYIEYTLVTSLKILEQNFYGLDSCSEILNTLIGYLC